METGSLRVGKNVALSIGALIADAKNLAFAFASPDNQSVARAEGAAGQSITSNQNITDDQDTAACTVTVQYSLISKQWAVRPRVTAGAQPFIS